MMSPWMLDGIGAYRNLFTAVEAPHAVALRNHSAANYTPSGGPCFHCQPLLPPQD